MATLRKTFLKPVPKRLKLSSGTIFYPTIPDSSQPRLAEVSSSTIGDINILLSQGWSITSGDPGSDGTRIYRGTWAGATTYRSGDVVKHSGVHYKANTSTSSEPPGAAWDLVTVGAQTAAVMHSGSGAPLSSFGDVGEYWLDTSGSGKIYGPKSLSGWGSGYSLGGGGSATSITESSGPTELTVGAISDGQYLKRVGSTVVGVYLALAMIADGNILELLGGGSSVSQVTTSAGSVA